MAVITPAEAPAAYEPDLRWTPFYRFARTTVELVVNAWCRPTVTGRDRVPLEGPAIIAPVHRSYVDFAFNGVLTRRKLFFMAKEELWKSPRFGRLLHTLGVFPVNRQGVDREALRRSAAVLDEGQLLVLFPEGARQSGPELGHLHEGAAFLAARTGAPIVPVGLAGSDRVMAKGAKVPRPVRVRVVVGNPVPAPARTTGGRVPRSTIHATTEALRRELQAAYDEARAEVPRASLRQVRSITEA